jgi:hypothetical protein
MKATNAKIRKVDESRFMRNQPQRLDSFCLPQDLLLCSQVSGGERMNQRILVPHQVLRKNSSQCSERYIKTGLADSLDRRAYGCSFPASGQENH